ncbi:MAG TPA: hypothetical protein VI753_07180, partial [Anaerolineales bacterium]|nr:hypothetical protein [Anaerolineales bacterium]
GQFIIIACWFQLHPIQAESAIHHVEVAVDETGHERAAIGINDACVRSFEELRVSTTANENNAVIPYGDRFSNRVNAISCKNVGIFKQ